MNRKIHFIILLIFSLLFLSNLTLSSYSTNAKIILDSDTIADIAQKVSLSVVNIDTSQELKESDSKTKSYNFGGIELHIPEIIPQPEAGTGSGIIFRDDGYILTNYHVIKTADKITVTLKDERKFEGKLIAHDSYIDLALIKIDAKNLLPVNFGDSKILRTGDWVIAIGSPLGLERTVTFRIISALSRHVGVTFGAAQGAFKYIQTDAAINPGNSGGPLVNLNGEVIGINTFIIGRNAQNLNFTIPGDYAKEIGDKLILGGTIKHPYLGIKMTTLEEVHLNAEGLPKDTMGAYVVEVVPKSPAHLNGVVPGDIIQKLDGIEITEPTKIAEIIRNKKVGDKIHIKLLRGGKVEVIKLKVGNLPDDEKTDKPEDKTNEKQEEKVIP